VKKTVTSSRGLLALVPALLAVVCGCSRQIVAVKEPDPCKLQVVTVRVISSTDINRADSGEARPVELRLYQLASDAAIENASFDDMWQKDKDVLQEDLVKVQEIPVYPGRTSEIVFERDEKAQTVAAVALFRNPRGRSWYTTFDLPPAPSEGKCALDCKGDDCPAPNLRPKLYVWLDESRVEDGAEHAEDPITSKVVQHRLGKMGGAPGVPSPPSVPQPPSTPGTPAPPSPPSVGVP
jgi:type VI secretion system protein VasD